MSTDDKVAIVYLARGAEGPAPLRQFVDSYRRYRAGAPHQLVVIFKGYDSQAELERARGVFNGCRYLGIEMDDSGFDIGSYFKAAARLSHTHLCLMNSFTEVAAPDWLSRMLAHAAHERVGLIAAMGSYESLHDTFLLMYKVNWLARCADIDYDERLHHYFSMYLDPHVPAWCQKASAGAPVQSRITAPSRTASESLQRRWLDARFQLYWWHLNSPFKPPQDWSNIPRFPNPHVRTTGFLVRRDHFLAAARPIGTKREAYEFESGRNSLTAFIQNLGLGVMVVGRDDRAFEIPAWPSSNTFRLGDQSNLLLTDAQSRGWAAISPGPRTSLGWVTWGEYGTATPPDFPDLGVHFRRRRLPAAAAGTGAVEVATAR